MERDYELWLINMTIWEEKQQLRAKLKSLLNKSSSLDLNTFSSKINSELLKLIKTNNWRRIGLFAPIHEEPNIWQIFENSTNETQSLQCFFPRIVSQNRIEFVEVHSRAELLIGKYSILEPSAESLKVDPSTLDVIFIPGLAFDQHGNRLGRGKGYYDKLLKTLSKKVTRVGVCFPFQVMEQVPHDENDQAVNRVVY